MNKEFKIRNEGAGRLMTGVCAVCTGLRAEGRASGVEVLLSGIIHLFLIINELFPGAKQLFRGKNEYFRSPEQYFLGKNEYFRSPEQYFFGKNEYSRSPEQYFPGKNEYFRSEKQLSQGKEVQTYLLLCLAVQVSYSQSIAPEKSGQAVGLSQRNRKHDINKGLQPHILKMWLKPVLLFGISCRRLKPTEIEEKEFQQFSINTGTFLTPASGVEGLPIYQANRKLGLPADKFFNN